MRVPSASGGTPGGAAQPKHRPLAMKARCLIAGPADGAGVVRAVERTITNWRGLIRWLSAESTMP